MAKDDSDTKLTKIRKWPPDDRAARPVLRIGSGKCQCTQCLLFFVGVSVFDRHQSKGAKCLTPEQMVRIGMIENNHGVWSWGKSTKVMSVA